VTTVFVADVSSNHNGNLERCLAFIDTAAAIGCNAIKFQLFKVRELFAPQILDKSERHRRREDWELPVGFLPALAARCRKVSIQFVCTPFYLDAVKELLTFVDSYKISSYELIWDDLLIACARTEKPVILSTGMATLEEVQGAVQVLRGAGCGDLTLLHCVSKYPAPIPQCNLAAIGTLRQTCNCPVGWSDHTVNTAVILRAVHAWQANMIEFHLDLDGHGQEYNMGHCWLPDQISPVISEIQAGFEADGSGEKVPSQCELEERDWRADPSNGLRPSLKKRKLWRG
jgi:sialic acid synthase SpsE